MADVTVELRGRNPKTVEVGGQTVTLQRVSFGRIKVSLDVPESDQVKILEWVEPASKDYSQHTNAELEALLVGMGIDPPARATKAQLIELLQKAEEGE